MKAEQSIDVLRSNRHKSGNKPALGLKRVLKTTILSCVLLSAAARTVAADEVETKPTTSLRSLAELEAAAAEQVRSAQSLRVEGVVCGFTHDRRVVALQDQTAAILLELPTNAGEIAVGDWVAIEGEQSVLERRGHAIRLEAPYSNDAKQNGTTGPIGSWKVITLGYNSNPAVSSLEQALGDKTRSQWIGTEGLVNFLGAEGSGLGLELIHAGSAVQVTVLDGAWTNLVHKFVLVRGIRERPAGGEQAWRPHIVVPSLAEIECSPGT